MKELKYFVVIYIGISADEEFFIVRGVGGEEFLQLQLKTPPTEEELRFVEFQDEDDENYEGPNMEIKTVCGEDIPYICPEGVYIIEIYHQKGKFYKALPDEGVIEEGLL